jgi:amidohydrolase
MGDEDLVSARDFSAEAQELSQRLISWRRDLHQHPELGFQEVRTAAIVAQHLKELGLEVRTGVGRTGVVALLHGGRPGPTVMLRADMDALPIQEISDAPYASQVPGVMHACGHDGHVAIGLGAATLLARHARELSGQVLFVFQPAEEGEGGARAMVEDGALDDPRPAAAFGLHLWNQMPAGRITAQSGPLMAAGDEIHIIVHGKGGHGALPHEAVDAIAVSGQILSALQTIVSRNVDPQETAVLSIGTVSGGTAFNVIADRVDLKGTIRTFSPAVRETVLARLRVLLDGVTKGMGASYELAIENVAAAVINDAAVSEVARAAAVEVAGATAVAWHPPLMVSEDFSEFQKITPACYLLLGSSNQELGLDAPHHNPRFDFDERMLPVGVALLATAAVRYLEEREAASPAQI